MSEHAGMNPFPEQAAAEILAARIVDGPYLARSQPGFGKLDDWLAELGAESDGLQRIIDAHPKVQTLLVGLADYSPYLWDLVRSDAARLVRILTTAPESRFPDLMADTRAFVSSTEDEAEAMRALRRMKSEAALLIALADIGGVWPVMQVTHALTELADCAVQAAVRFAFNKAIRQEQLLPTDPSQPEKGSGYVVLAMGKMGAFELNYSSDIDLIVFFDPDSVASTLR